MTPVLSLLAVASIVELSLWLPPLWQLRKILACGLILAVSLLSGLLFGQHPGVWTGLVLILSTYRLVNLLRVLENRLQSKQLYQVTRRTSYWLISWQVAVVAFAGLIQRQAYSTLSLWYILAGVQLIVALVLFTSTRRHLRTTQPPVRQKHYPDAQLPSLSVLIPARNETDDLQACLQSLIASDYPKLEIIVLDDCSQNKHTPGIIRDFAQSGVRFIAGKTPPTHWLAKNYAYQQLADEANGELLLFCGVDTRFQTSSLRAMVEAALQKNKQMVSFIPRNQSPPAWSVESLFVQPARYAWELSPPRRLVNRPPVLSTCWLIVTATLQQAGGFGAASHSISPESYLARYAIHHGDGYSFMQSDATINVTSVKSLSAQRATAIRTRYPQLHRRPELVALIVLGELATFTAPFVAVVISLLSGQLLLAGVSGLACLLLTGFYCRVVTLTYRRFLLRSLWTLPLVALYDLGLLNYSMWQYEFREVIWKGRNVCIPVMRTVSAASKL